MGLLILLFTTSISGSSPLVVHEQRDVFDDEIATRSRIEGDTLLPVRIGLKQNQHAAENAEKWLMEVSHPDSPKYGQHWSQEDVIEAFKPSEHTIGNVTEWLNGHGIDDFTHSDNKLWFAFDLPAAQLESLLQTEYYERLNEGGEFEAACDRYSLPEYLQDHIDYITPGATPSVITGRTARGRSDGPEGVSTSQRDHDQADGPIHSSQQRDLQSAESKAPKPPYQSFCYPPIKPPYNSSTSLEHCHEQISPACVRALYNVSLPDPFLPISPNNSLGVFEMEDMLCESCSLVFDHGVAACEIATR